MKMTKIVAISAFGILLTACDSNQMQNEGSAPAMESMGAKHTHKVEGYGEFSHQHKGNSTENHGHSWGQIQTEINKQ